MRAPTWLGSSRTLACAFATPSPTPTPASLPPRPRSGSVASRRALPPSPNLASRTTVGDASLLSHLTSSSRPLHHAHVPIVARAGPVPDSSTPLM
uniref:Uncharacterized protein n=1 Tax=Zea mays TaxID=4577 RepID=B4FWV2_MAIZE|nr:unknown [Zea mays]|eukprot:NP_001141547.1 uncharacterized protein LOC100273662 [Zea mays]